jgi:enamine deaminase RidA (YjgF/YER057c/UK114 family)
MSKVLTRLKEKGIELPAAPAPMGAYVPAVRAGNLVFVSGQLPRQGDAMRYRGKVDAELTLPEAQAAARLAALNAVAALGTAVPDLDRVRRIVKVRVSVASSPGFVNQPQVANAASELLVEVFGEAGRHARMAVGVAELPGNAAVAVELVAEVEA